MARYLLDTTAIVDFSKGFQPTTSRIRHLLAAGEDLRVCPITVTEFYAGLAPAFRPDWDEFFAALTFWPISYGASVQAGTWRYAFARQGVQLTTADTLVAAVAQEASAVVLTSNARDYPMGIALVDPRV